MSNMNNNFLKDAARKAGISEKQAIAFVAAILHPSNFMCEMGRKDRSIGSFEHPSVDLSGTTYGEFLCAEAARHWRAMCMGLLSESPAEWGDMIFPYPKEDFDTYRLED